MIRNLSLPAVLLQTVLRLDRAPQRGLNQWDAP